MGRQFYPAFVAFILVMSGWLISAEAATVTVQWDSNRESDLAGYTIFYGTGRHDYASSVDVGNHTSYQVSGLDSGRTYYFVVRAYNFAGLQSPFSTEVSTTTSGSAPGGASPSKSLKSALSVTSLIANMASPQEPGTVIGFTAGAGGGVAPYQYKWLLSDGQTTRVMQNWSAANTFAWRSGVMSANYTVRVQVRNAGSTADAPESSNAELGLPFEITSNRLVALDLTADKDGPQSPGTSIVFTLSTHGAPSAYQFQWSVFNGTAWVVMQDWSSAGTYTWTPTVANPQYRVKVSVRGGKDLASQPGVSMPFPIAAN